MPNLSEGNRMTERTHLASEPVHAATRQLQSIVELLDILWEQARGQTPPPTSPPHSYG